MRREFGKIMEKMRDQDMKTVLVTGGAGYIGSHACVELLRSRGGR